VTHIWQKPILIENNTFRFRGVNYTIIKEIDSWVEAGAWWQGEPILKFLLVKTEPYGLFEIALTPKGQSILYQSYD
jgi:hypothetical protein